ncbi:MAG: mechanosensitive ion channel [Thiocapsa sp.]|nr:mechanosensitive ion channel domain-containing protein [Thiocapsa sp.]MCG6985288.1 mechanosensitive ion channel [Thiocapsa sp.]
MTSEDFERAQGLIEARLAELVGPGTEGASAESAEPSEAAPADDAAEGQAQAQDPRLAALEALLLAVEQGAVLAARDRDLDASLAEEEAELDNVETQGLGIDPPYPIAILDQLRTQRALTEYSNELVEQRRAQAQRQVDLSAEELVAAMSERRGLRDRLATAEDAGTRRALERDLEVARINTLVALWQHDNALAQQNLARDEDDLTAAQLALLERKIAVVQDDVMFSPEALESRLAEEMPLIQDQVRTLGQRLRSDLEPRVQERSVDQRLEQVQEQLAQWWDTEIAVVQDHGIYTRDAVTALGVFLLVYVIVWLVQLVLRRRVLPKLAAEAKQGEEERRTLRAVISPLIRNTSQLFVLVVAFYAAMSVSGLGQGKLQEWLWTLLIVALYVQIGIWANAGVVDFFERKRSPKEREDPSAVTGYGLLLFFIRVGIWLMVGVSVLTYFKYPVAGLIGALGVGGIAVAFAVQNILSDVFSSMAIILDKPFRVGDFVVAGETVGVIEHIGVKTTRIKSLSGEQVVMSNTDLLGSCIHNYTHMRERRVVFKIGVVYETPADKLERIPDMIAEIIRAQPRARFDRAHFFEYGDFSLVFEIVYYVYGADYVVYMDTQQAINLAIDRRFQAEGISFAYPTQELIVRRTPDATALT